MNPAHIIGLLLLLAGLALVWVTVRAVRSEPRRLANGALIAVAVGVLSVAVTLLGLTSVAQLAVLAVFISPLLVLLLVALLLWNGLTMVRREGRSLGNLLSLLAGLGITASMAVSFGLLTERVTIPLALWVVLAASWLALLFIGYVGYGWLYQRLASASRPDYIVTLGSGLIGDRVPPLLAGRIDRALAIHRAELAAGRHPVLVMSGGKGGDEAVAEAVAMARYAQEKGVDAADLLVEDRSATTEQNLRFTSELVSADPRLGDGARGLAVTSNYHVMRAAMLAREQDLDVQVTGAHTAAYFWPSAVLREFVAVLLRTWRWQLLGLALATLPLPLLLATADLWS